VTPTDIAESSLAVNNGAVLVRDLTPPTSFSLTEPADGAWTSNNLPTFKWSASSDAASGVARYQLIINENVDQPNIAPSLTSITPANPLGDGDYSWKVLAIDGANNSRVSDQVRLIRIDSTPPSSGITSPSPGADITQSSVTITGSASDQSGSGVDSVHVSIDGGQTWNNAISTGAQFGTWSYQWSGIVNGNYTLRSRAFDRAGNIETPGEGIAVTVQITAILEPDVAGVPGNFGISQNYPNPFNPETTIEFALPRASHVKIEIFDILGKPVRSLVDERLEAGFKTVKWDGRNQSGSQASSGVYLCRLQAGTYTATRKLILTR
jgi:hypothetical protein